MERGEAIELTVGGEAVRGVYHAAADAAAPAVVFAHGFGSTRVGEKAEALAAECAARGWGFAAGDFRGHGASGGTMLGLRGSRLLEDLGALAVWVAARHAGPLCLCGSSMGGWAAAWFAARGRVPVAACAFVAPAFHFPEQRRLTPEEREAWQRTGRHRVRNEWVDVEIGWGLAAEAGQFPADALAAQLQTPFILFHGMRDEVVPYAESLEFAGHAAAPEVEVVLIGDGDHRLSREKGRIARAVCDFFAGRAGLKPN